MRRAMEYLRSIYGHRQYGLLGFLAIMAITYAVHLPKTPFYGFVFAMLLLPLPPLYAVISHGLRYRHWVEEGYSVAFTRHKDYKAALDWIERNTGRYRRTREGFLFADKEDALRFVLIFGTD